MKISVIMQSYLGNYPGSRSNPEEKFHRAVKSFLNQTYSEKELVIVSDGCPKTMKIFYENYALYDNIKFLYLHNSKERMYSLENGNTLYRGKPKALGVEFATGDIITYMDSDDIILPKRLEDLYLNWKDKDDNILWSNNPMRYMNSKHVRNVNKYHLTLEDRTSFFYDYGIDDEYVLNSVLESKEQFVFLGGTWALSHRKHLVIKWMDSFDIPEDHLFLKKLISIGQGFCYESPTYILCHCSNSWGLWDN